jgi:transcriptional regulator with XRE-family HTH domain
MALGTELAALRKSAGYSQEQMSRELGLRQAEISAVEHDRSVFTESRHLIDWLSLCGADAETSRLLDLWRERALAAGIEF